MNTSFEGTNTKNRYIKVKLVKKAQLREECRCYILNVYRQGRTRLAEGDNCLNNNVGRRISCCTVVACLKIDIFLKNARPSVRMTN